MGTLEGGCETLLVARRSVGETATSSPPSSTREVTCYDMGSYDAMFRETPQVPPEGRVALYDVSYSFLAVLLRVRSAGALSNGAARSAGGSTVIT